MAKLCLDRIDQLPRDKDREFVRSVYRQVVIMRRGATPNQQPWLKDLYLKLGGTI